MVNKEKLEQMAEEYFKKTGRVPTEWAVMNFMDGAEAALNLPEVKALIEAGDNMREELTNYWGGSKGELGWLKALQLAEEKVRGDK